jgi:hypothetical protein
VDGRERQRQRTLRTPLVQPAPDYPANVLVVIRKLKQAGLEVVPYRRPRPSNPRYVPVVPRMLLVNGVLCRVYCRRAAIQTGRSGREYVRFCVGKKTKAVKAALFAFWRGRRLKLYVFPVRELKKLGHLATVSRQVRGR